MWNLIGPGNVRHDDDFFYAVVIVVPNGPQPMGEGGGEISAVSPKTTKNKDRWTARGEWVVANQLAWSEENGYVGGDMFDTMTDSFKDKAETFGMTVLPTRSEGAFRIRFESAGNPGPIADWQAFRQAVYNPASRNLFYSGHGGTTGIGYNLSNTNVSISASEIASVLRTVPAGQTNRHNYRFVFIDGCDTASSCQLAQAFGIVPKENVMYDYYNASGERTSAFVGWNIKPAVGFAQHTALMQHVYYMLHFGAIWGTGPGLRDALDQAKNYPDSNDINPKKLTVFGYRNLGYLQGNNN